MFSPFRATPVAIFLFAFGLISPGARADFQVMIENGTPVNRSEALARTVALVQFKKGGFCSSSFLSPRTLITAGHCAENHQAGDIMVSVQNANGSWEQRALARLIPHPQYSHKVKGSDHIMRNDLAIMQLVSPFSFPVRTVNLSAPNAAMAAGNWQAVTDVGYGYLRPGSGGSVLRRGSMVGRVKKIAQFDNRQGIEQNKTNANQNACPGDSGGAVLLGGPESRDLVSVHSLADGCTSQSTVTYSEMVWPARAWIQSQIVP